MQVPRSIVVLTLGALVAAFATGAQDEGIKVGVVDLEHALLSTEEGKAAREELERKGRDAQGQLEPMVTRLQDLEEEVKSKQFVLSEDALRQKVLDGVEMRNDIQIKQKELESRLKVDQERILGPLQKKMVDIVQTIGKENGFTLILTRSAPGLVYSREALDITDMVVERFNSQS